MIYKIKVIVFLFLYCFLNTNTYAESLCGKNESIVFNCQLAKSTASLCFVLGRKQFVYRKGTGKKIELQVEDDPNGEPRFLLSNTPYSGGGEAHVHFLNHDYSYFLYDKKINGDDGPEFSAGVLVFHDSKRVANLVCENDASIHSVAYEEMKKEDYDDIGVR